MRILLYEAITGGACWSRSDLRPDGPLLREGMAMARALAEDFAALPNVQVVAMHDVRVPQLPAQIHERYPIDSATEERQVLTSLAAECDATLIIAPELDGVLAERCEWVQSVARQMLSPGEEFVRIASSKTLTVQALAHRGIRVPRAASSVSPFPLVLKRDDGAGSMGMRLVRSPQELVQSGIELQGYPHAGPLPRGEGAVRLNRVEEFVPGMPTSVSVLCGPAGRVPLAPCEQILEKGTFSYFGGRTPLPPLLARRATRLALAALDALPVAVGYVGIDLVLGDAEDGSADTVIEVNPRLTSSYIGLRRACRSNLAEAILDVAAGRSVSLRFDQQPIEFRPDD